MYSFLKVEVFVANAAFLISNDNLFARDLKK